MTITVRFLPSSPSWLNTPYLYHLVRCLPEFGVEPFIPARNADWLSGRWILSNPDHVDILHFHWTAYHYAQAKWFDSVKALCGFQSRMLLAKLKGFKIVWTMHNYMPHEVQHPRVKYVERFLMARLADSVIVHCAHGSELIRHRLFRKSKVFVVPLGNFGEFLPRYQRAEARACLGLPDNVTVLLFFGQIRAYKGLVDLLRSLNEIEDDRLRLVVIGTLGAESESSLWAREIREFTAMDNRVLAIISSKYIPDEAFTPYLSAADVAVFPFRRILTSASVITALSFGLPVVAPRLGCLPEVLDDDCGVLYDPGEGSLANALRTCLRGDLPQMGQAARRRAEQLSWQDMVRRTAHVYEHTLNGTEVDAW